MGSPDASQRAAAEQWFLDRGLPSVLRPGALARGLWTRSAPALAAFAVMMAFSIVIVIGWLALAAIVGANIATGAAAITSAPGGIKVGGNNTTQALVCNDSHVTVGGNSNTITATGHCASLTVSGSSNQVSIESADIISTSGVGNAITYQSGTPRVTTAGVSNTVSRR
jgi:Protein of unknown function (DUF3060)